MTQYKNLEGKTVETVRPMTRAELNDMDWRYTGGRVPVVIIMTDGTEVVPMADPEGNYPGALDVSEPIAVDSCGGCGLVFPLAALTDLTRPNHDPNMVYSCTGCLTAHARGV